MPASVRQCLEHNQHFCHEQAFILWLLTLHYLVRYNTDCLRDFRFVHMEQLHRTICPSFSVRRKFTKTYYGGVRIFSNVPFYPLYLAIRRDLSQQPARSRGFGENLCSHVVTSKKSSLILQSPLNDKLNSLTACVSGRILMVEDL